MVLYLCLSGSRCWQDLHNAGNRWRPRHYGQDPEWPLRLHGEDQWGHEVQGHTLLPGGTLSFPSVRRYVWLSICCLEVCLFALLVFRGTFSRLLLSGCTFCFPPSVRRYIKFSFSCLELDLVWILFYLEIGLGVSKTLSELAPSLPW